MVDRAPRANVFHRLAVASITPQTRDAVVVTFAVPPELREAYRFHAGQFVTLRASIDGEELRRSYSICAAPHEGALCVAIKRVDDGRFSRFAHETFVPGASIDVAPPDGRFGAALVAATGRNFVAFAAGSGITPILSIVKATMARDPTASFTLVYGNRASSTTMFRSELLDLKDRYVERLTLLFVMSREQQDVELFNGRIDRAKCDALFSTWIDLSRTDATFVCGPYDMMQAVTGALAARGVPAAQVRTELFGAAASVPRKRLTAADVAPDAVRAYAVADGRRRDFTIERGSETVL
ncbi:MAG: phenylacetic acid degradation protein, partial [Candidatus Eremiobacteraeota bacterium]|nr:phenylacetic acid degradation protein [Candidatus Eremiobacteraeota bacterium]